MRRLFQWAWIVLAFGFSAVLDGSPVRAAEVDVQRVRDEVRAYRGRNELAIVHELARLVALPNDAASLSDMEGNAELLAALLERRRFDVSLLRVPGAPPVVFAERSAEGAERSVVFYAHYDGQPVVSEDWHSDPWQLVVRTQRVEQGGAAVPLEDLRAPLDPEWRLYGRSTSDDKGSIVALLAAIDALDAAGLEIAIDMKILLDGEEERGSPHMAQVLRTHRDRLAADLWVFCDGPVHQTRRPQVVYGVRGVTAVEITAYGPAVALHSGHYGNWAPDPGMQLAELVVSLRDEDGDLAVEGVDELVRPLSDTARRAVEAAPAVDGQLKRDLVLAASEGEPETLAERITRPGVNLLGFEVGRVGDEAANAIAATATAVVGFRLVPEVTPEVLREAVERHVEERGFFVVYHEPGEAVRRSHPRVVWLQWEEGYPALWTDMELPIVRRVASIVDAAVDGAVVHAPTMGGSLPLQVFSRELGAPPIVVVPIANHDNNQHAADENLRLANLWQGIEIYAALMSRL